MAQKGKGPDQIYLESLTATLTGWNDPEMRLVKAFELDEFILFGQHIVPLDADGGLPAYVEILVRLKEEERNLTPPGHFIPFLEYYGMMPLLDRWVVEHALEWWRSNSDAQNSVMSVNLSPGTLGAADFPEFVDRQLRRKEVSGKVLCFELTQSEIAADPALVAKSVPRLKTLGCGFAISGFGHETVSFEALKSVPASLIKIDGAIIRGIVIDSMALAKVKAIQQVCKKVSVRSVAEGVEQPEAMKLLRDAGVDYAQGYGISRPGPLEPL
jgi:EAL domain-containing protein (putative c-di-GMP-specific phosphodiesterase class I)